MNSSLTQLDREMQASIEKVPKLNKELIKEVGVLGRSTHLGDYISRLIFGRCYVFRNGGCYSFVLPEDKIKLFNYLQSQTIAPGDEVLIDLSPVAICVLIDKDYMYSLEPSY